MSGDPDIHIHDPCTTGGTRCARVQACMCVCAQGSLCLCGCVHAVSMCVQSLLVCACASCICVAVGVLVCLLCALCGAGVAVVLCAIGRCAAVVHSHSKCMIWGGMQGGVDVPVVHAVGWVYVAVCVCIHVHMDACMHVA